MVYGCVVGDVVVDDWCWFFGYYGFDVIFGFGDWSCLCWCIVVCIGVSLFVIGIVIIEVCFVVVGVFVVYGVMVIV